MDSATARRIIESFRKGIPADGHVRHFTVGREKEIEQLHSYLKPAVSSVLLLKANYGSGKTHLLKYIREAALDEGYAVSLVTVDSGSAVRFNRMDQIFGAICRAIELPDKTLPKGIRSFFDYLVNDMRRGKRISTQTHFWYQLSNGWQWDGGPACLESNSVYVGFRAWTTGEDHVKNLVEDWLTSPWNFYSQKLVLYSKLIVYLCSYFRDCRGRNFYLSTDTFNLQNGAYVQSWLGLKDLDRLAKGAGLKGLILLFDEFEDIIYNLNNINYQISALANLCSFFEHRLFPGLACFAVTPTFINKCYESFYRKGYVLDQEAYEKLPTFAMSPLAAAELQELAMRIMETHGLAYNWEPDSMLKASELKKIVNNASWSQVQDRARYTIKQVVQSLDRLLEDDEE